MDALTFIVEMTKALAWPLSLVVALISYRKTILKALDRLNEVSVAGFGAKFADKSEEVAERIQEVVAVTGQLPPPSERAQSDLYALAEISPRAATLEAWIQIERLLVQIGEKNGITGGIAPAYRLVQQLKDRGTLDSKDVAAIEGLRTLRNLAAHAPQEELSRDKAVEFLTLASAVEFILRRKL